MRLSLRLSRLEGVTAPHYVPADYAETKQFSATIFILVEVLRVLSNRSGATRPLAENVRLELLLLLPRQACYRYTTFSILCAVRYSANLAKCMATSAKTSFPIVTFMVVTHHSESR